MNSKRITITAMSVVFIIYSIVVYTSGTAATAAPKMTAEARHGQDVFQNNNCIACHQFYGLGGYMGPDLTNVISNKGEAYSRAFISGGTVRMPSFKLDEDDLSALLAYLAFVDQTGTYPPEKYEIEWYGNVSQADDPR